MQQMQRLQHQKKKRLKLSQMRKEAAEIIQNAQDGAVSSTVKTLDSARSKAGKEAEGVQAEGAKSLKEYNLQQAIAEQQQSNL